MIKKLKFLSNYTIFSILLTLINFSQKCVHLKNFPIIVHEKSSIFFSYFVGSFSRNILQISKRWNFFVKIIGAKKSFKFLSKILCNLKIIFLILGSFLLDLANYPTFCYQFWPFQEFLWFFIDFRVLSKHVYKNPSNFSWSIPKNFIKNPPISFLIQKLSWKTVQFFLWSKKIFPKNHPDYCFLYLFIKIFKLKVSFNFFEAWIETFLLKKPQKLNNFCKKISFASPFNNSTIKNSARKPSQLRWWSGKKNWYQRTPSFVATRLA